jgi:hypothetical protein
MDDAPPELDREAILARRRRFIALAISGIATAGCDKPLPEPQPCLSMEQPPEERTSPTKPFVEDPGVPLGGEAEVEDPEPGSPETGEHDEADPAPPTKPAPRPCLNVAPKQPPQQQTPRPCLMVELSPIQTRDDDHG